MTKSVPISGAIPVDDMPRRQGGRQKIVARDGGDASDRPDKVVEKPGSKGSELNPYCTCAPCNCTPPCTCGLEMTTQEITTEWFEHGNRLVYSVVETWVPKSNSKRAR